MGDRLCVGGRMDIVYVAGWMMGRWEAENWVVGGWTLVRWEA